HLEEAPPDARLEAQRAALLGVEPVARSALPPLPDLAREDLERTGGIDRDHGGHRGDLGGLHGRLPRGPRSAWALKAPSCSAQNASTRSSQARRSVNGSRRSRYTRRRESRGSPR